MSRSHCPQLRVRDAALPTAKGITAIFYSFLSLRYDGIIGRVSRYKRLIGISGIEEKKKERRFLGGRAGTVYRDCLVLARAAAPF